MNKSEVEAFLISQLAKSRGDTHEEVLLDLEHTGVIESLEGVELVIGAEHEFGIAISDSELSSDVCQSIPELVALIRSKLDSGRESQGETDR